MKRELSILIPVFNDRCGRLARQLDEQAAAIDGLKYEIVIGDDGSTDRNVVDDNRRAAAEGLNRRLITNQDNRGRAAIRNALADAAKYQWLLFIDGGHMQLCGEGFLQNYLACDDSWPVVYGGYCLSKPSNELKTSNLRYKYERQSKQNMSAEMRSSAPAMDFQTNNFLINKDVFRTVRFDERFVRYGYEDVFMGKSLSERGIQIYHIDNPVERCDYEANAVFLQKTIDSLLTLKEFEAELAGYSRLLNNVRLCRKLKIDNRLRNLYLKRKARWTANLEGPNPSLTIFKLFKLGYFLSL
ncbi:MAG: glycosyltransferase family 2 protein [Prevotella sp.]|nr:glycosyltransferase family 2 protein [Prevotella sp.]